MRASKNYEVQTLNLWYNMTVKSRKNLEIFMIEIRNGYDRTADGMKEGLRK